MASGGLLAVIDDITAILDDVAAMSKVAARKTAGIVGDDLAVNANVVVGIDPSRELPIVGKIALGSLANKAVLIPIALALPTSMITPLLMVGGAFLCYEAIHKITHKSSPVEQEISAPVTEAPTPEELRKLENKKVMGAIGTDFILSAEVIAVALGSLAASPLPVRAMTLTVVGIAMTIGVYGLVAAIVKVDDLGLHLQSSEGEEGLAPFKRRLGRWLVSAMPHFMKFLSFLGTAAMFTVGGGIILHAFPALEHALEGLASGPLGTLVSLVGTLVFGMLIGLISSPLFSLPGWILKKIKKN